MPKPGALLEDIRLEEKITRAGKTSLLDLCRVHIYLSVSYMCIFENIPRCLHLLIMVVSVQAPISTHSNQDTTKQNVAYLAQLLSVREGLLCFLQQ